MEFYCHSVCPCPRLRKWKPRMGPTLGWAAETVRQSRASTRNQDDGRRLRDCAALSPRRPSIFAPNQLFWPITLLRTIHPIHPRPIREELCDYESCRTGRAEEPGYQHSRDW